MEQTMKAAEEELLNTELARRFRGGVIMDVVNPEQARIAEEAGACAVMALERVPSDIRAAGGVARMSDPGMIREIKAAVSIPVMAKCRIGHFVEARVLEAVDVDYIDESEVLTPADEEFHIDKTTFRTPFVCGCRNLGEALRRIAEGASMIRTKGEAGTGDVVEAVRHARCVTAEIRRVQVMPAEELVACAKEMGAPVELLWRVKALLMSTAAAKLSHNASLVETTLSASATRPIASARRIPSASRPPLTASVSVEHTTHTRAMSETSPSHRRATVRNTCHGAPGTSSNSLFLIM